MGMLSALPDLADPLFFNSSGRLLLPRTFVSPVITSATGSWSINYTISGITTIYSIFVQALSPQALGAGNQFLATVTTVTATTISGGVNSGVLLLLLSNTVIPITAPTTVWVTIVGI